MKKSVIILLLGVVIIAAAWWFFAPWEEMYEADVTTTKEDAASLADTSADAEEEISPQPITLEARTITSSAGIETTFRLPKEFNITVVAEELGKARFMAMSPDGRLFVPDLVNYELSHEGKIWVLEDFNEETGQFETKHEYLSDLRGPNDVAFYTDEDGNDWIYIALTKNLIRYPYTDGDTEPSGEPEVIIEFPNAQALEAKSVVWHITRTIDFHDGRVYASAGSGCNACEQPEGEMRGMIMSALPDGSDLQMYADGLRNSVGFDWAGETLYATDNGVDHLGVGAPDEMLYAIEEGMHYGWPYCYESDGEIISDNSVNWQRAVACEDVPRPIATFEPHAAPLGVTYFGSAHPVLQNSFLVALHGSFDPNVKGGYEIVRVTRDGEKDVFMDGFQNENGERFARPVDMLQRDENSFFFTDDFGERVFLISAR